MAEHIKIVIDAVDNATKPLGKVSAAMSGMQKAGSSLKLGFTELNSMLSLAASAGRIVGQVFNDTVGKAESYARSVMDLSVGLGIAAEESSYLYQIADDLKIPVSNLEMAFKQAVMHGIQPNIESIKDLAAEYQAIEDPVERGQYAMKIFGMRAGPEMQKLLEATPEAIDEMAKSAEDAGLILSGEMVQASRDYEIAVDDMNDAVEGLKIQIGLGLMPVLTDLLTLTASQGWAKLFGVSEESTFAQIMAIDMSNISNWWEFGEAVKAAGEKADLAEDSARDMNEQLRDSPQLVGDMNERLREVPEAADPAALSLDGVADATYTAADAMADYNEKLLFNLASKALGDNEAAILSLAQRMGLVDEATVTATKKTDEFAQMLEDKKISVDTYTALIAGMRDRIAELQSKEVDVTVNTYENYHTNGVPTINPNATSNATQQAYASGANFVVPPGYPNDSYGPIYVESGEHVKITPANEVAKDMRTFNFNYSGNASAQQIRQSYEMARLLG